MRLGGFRQSVPRPRCETALSDSTPNSCAGDVDEVTYALGGVRIERRRYLIEVIADTDEDVGQWWMIPSRSLPGDGTDLVQASTVSGEGIIGLSRRMKVCCSAIDAFFQFGNGDP